MMGCKSIRVQPRPAGSAKGGIENRPAKAQDGTAASPPGETCQRRPIFPGSFPPSIFGTNELNFRVRNGNGWTLIVKDTDYCIESGYGSYRSQTTGARRHFLHSRPLPPAGRPSRRPQRSGRVLCHTRVRFGLSFGGAPSGIRTRDPLIKSQLLYQLS